ncbi:hypothetical protein ABQE21_01510 [Enterococcus casseliflavus]|uniref:hypothetical protein n=1 Tax=Enterococcus casseliflavus TaxID=37734 RepID=UPI0032E424A7
MNLLLIMPNFFTYPQDIVDELESMGFKVDFFDDRPSVNPIIKSIIRINKNLINFYIKSYFKKIILKTQTKEYSYVFVISGQSFSFSKEMVRKLKNQNKNAEFILYQWDSLANFSYIKDFYEFFDRKYSFDQLDCQKVENLEFLPLFYTKQYGDLGVKKYNSYQYDFSFVGTAHPKKYAFIKEVTQKLYDVYPSQFIYLYMPSKIIFYFRKITNKLFKKASINEFNYIPLAKNEVSEVYANSSCILDSAQDNQNGLTIRIIEALGAKKKVITTNENVKEYDFYKEENIYIYNGQIDFDSKFFNEPYSDVEASIYESYSLESWLKKIIEKKNGQ